MVRRDYYLSAAWPWPRVPPLPALLIGLLIGLVGGCGTSLTPEQTAAMAKLQDLGARINFRPGGYEVDLTETTVEDKDLVHLKKIPNLKTLDLRGTRVTDAGLEHLRSNDSLEFVDLTRTKATVMGVEDLRKSLPNTDVLF